MAHGNDGFDAVDHGIPAPGQRLPGGTRVGRVRLQVAELERSLDYYGRVLGLRVLERSAGDAALGAAGAAGPLIELRERPGAAPVPARGRPGLYHFALLLPDRAALGSLVRHLSETGERAGASDHLVSEALYLRDPDGLGIEVYADRPRSAWRWREGELLMATEPLDVAALADAAGAAVWRGMPAGTSMGHVHLHVGDLAQAAAFYHEALGFDKMVWSYPGALFLSAGGYHHHLGVNTWAAGAAPAGAQDAQLLEWELVVPAAADAERVLASLRAGGHPAERAGADVLTSDPWGTRLRIRAGAVPVELPRAPQR
jgi:catechol 2,3-dioxygenase